jgi:hypothetical protein
VLDLSGNPLLAWLHPAGAVFGGFPALHELYLDGTALTGSTGSSDWPHPPCTLTLPATICACVFWGGLCFSDCRCSHFQFHDANQRRHHRQHTQRSQTPARATRQWCAPRRRASAMRWRY